MEINYMYKINYSYIFYMSIFFLYEHIFYKLYIQVKFKFMKNKKIRECLHLFYIKIKNILNKIINLLLPPMAT
jgi:hypothetical protein